MVGFIHQAEAEENNLSSKLKNPVDTTWCDKLDFIDQFVPEFEDLSLPVNTYLLDFDSIKDWIEEMQDSDADKYSETLTSYGGDVLLEGPSVEKENLCSLKKEQTAEVREEMQDSDVGKCSGECLEKVTEGFVNYSPVEEDADKLLSLNSVVEEGLGKFSLVNEEEFHPIDQNNSRKDNAVASEVVEAESDESSASVSESGSSSDCSSSSSSSSSEDKADDALDEEEKDEKIIKEERICQVKEEPEEGEIMETDAHKIASRRNEDDNENHSKDSLSKGGTSGEILMDDDEEDIVVGPIMSKNELKVLPPVPPVDVTLQPSHQMLPVGIVNSKHSPSKLYSYHEDAALHILGDQVIVEGGVTHNPLSEGSILWITEKKYPLGRVDEIFGPVKNPYYIVRYNSESEVPEGIHEGSLVSFVPEFVDHVLNNKNLYQKGYDASGNDDEEVDEAEFSDDEQEAEYRRMIKMSKRGNKADVKPGGYKKSHKSLIRNDARSNNCMQAKDLLPAVQLNNMPSQQLQSPMRWSPNHNVQPGFGPALTAGFPQQGQTSRFRPNGVQPSVTPFQMQTQELSNGYQMPWAQQDPMMNSARPPFQQAFNPNNNVPLSMALQAQLAQLSMLSGMLLAGQQSGPPPNAQGPPPQFNQGATSFQPRGGRFRGRGRRGGGRSFQSRFPSGMLFKRSWS
ncbi:hypothetical protein V2J09_008982 [Rumex salicifolius]